MSEDINIGAISEALNNKVDLDANNLSDSGKSTIAGLGMPDYTAGVLKQWNVEITATRNCFIYIESATSLNSYCALRVDGAVAFYDLNSGSGTPRTSGFIPVAKGSVYKAEGNANVLVEYPVKGV